jgi:hypothetical protein
LEDQSATIVIISYERNKKSGINERAYKKKIFQLFIIIAFVLTGVINT